MQSDVLTSCDGAENVQNCYLDLIDKHCQKIPITEICKLIHDKFTEKCNTEGDDLYIICNPKNNFGFCTSIDSFWRRFFLTVAFALNIIIYSGVFLLGLRNIV